MLRKIRDFLTWSNLSAKLKQLWAFIVQFFMWSNLKPRLKQFGKDFAKFMVFDTISAVLISLIVIHFAVPGV